ncbi:hypothetical protein [Reichenbachiella agariperforans]|uniref:hypothetical protein n=1 Tax=Reichenbachiella agariperforans TaxID=156994 RepID=UPI001C087B15|nr:hypothetical protein [Reichenbachiella agariperforans]MBU2913373.1 hypothetical protein [Reichenbachiella agariperforans]
MKQRDDMKKKAFKLILIIVLFIPLATRGQAYVGGGYMTSTNSDSHDVKGVEVVIQSKYQIKDSRFAIMPSVNMGLLYEYVNKEYLESYTTTLSIAANGSFDIIRSKWVIFSLFAGPVIRWEHTFEPGSESTFNEYEARANKSHEWGYELGVTLDVRISDKISTRLIPFAVQRTLKEQSSLLHQTSYLTLMIGINNTKKN